MEGQLQVLGDKLPVHPVDDENHVTRQEAARRACEAAGIDFPPTILPPGTALYESGVEKLKADRAHWARMPTVAEAVPLVIQALETEERADYDVDVNKLRLKADTGRVVSLDNLDNPDVKGFGFSAHSFRQLMQQIPSLSSGNAPRGMTSALLHLSDHERAD